MSNDYENLRPEAANVLRRLDELGLTQREFAEAIGIDEIKVSKVRSGVRQLKADEVLKAHDWLDGIEQAKSAQIRPLSIKHAPDRMPIVNAEDGVVEIISLDLSLSMGSGSLLEEFIEQEPVKMDLAFLRALTRSAYDRLRFVKGVGDSMEPTLRTNDRVLVDTSETELRRLHGVYWIEYQGAHGLKRLRPVADGRIKIISDNENAGETFEVERDHVRIHGRAIWFGRDL